MAELVTVVIPAYNPGRYLMAALDSLLAQSMPDWRCVVVDDGSTEDLAWVQDVDPRIELLRQENRGVSAARNVGTALAAGPYVAYLDADDLWGPEKLALQVIALQGQPDAVLCHTGGRIVDADGTRTESWPYGRQYDGYRDLLRSPFLGTPSVLVRRSSLQDVGGWDETLRYAEDVDLWLRLIRLGPFVYLPQELFSYRQHDSNATRDVLPLVRDTRTVYDRQRQRALLARDQDLLDLIDGLSRQMTRGWGATAYDHARQHANNRQLGKAARSLVAALRLNPAYTGRSAALYVRTRGASSR